MPKKKRREKEKRERAEQKKADTDRVSLEVLNAYRQANGHEPLECLLLDFNPNLVSAPSLDAPSPNEGSPLKGSQAPAPLKRITFTPLKGSQARASLERAPLEENPQPSPEEESVLDTTLDTTNEGSDSELDWGHDTTIASAILGMNKLQGAETSGGLALPSKRDWTFDELPQAGRAEGDGEMVLSSAGNHMIWVPSQGLVQETQPAIRERNPPPITDDDRNYEVDYNDEESQEEDGGNVLESNHAENVIERNGKEVAEPDPRLIMGAGSTAIAKRNAVLTQKIMMDIAATKQIRLHLTVTSNTTTSGIRRGRVRL